MKHIVVWKFKDHTEGADRAANVAQAQAVIEPCAALVQGTLRFEVLAAQPGLPATIDLMLYAEFADAATLDAYQNHPQHLAFKRVIGPLLERRDRMDCVVADDRDSSAIMTMCIGGGQDK